MVLLQIFVDFNYSKFSGLLWAVCHDWHC